MTAPHAAIDPKAIATLKAKAALAGYALELIEGDDGRPEVCISRWALTQRFADLAEVEAWLARAAGPKA